MAKPRNEYESLMGKYIGRPKREWEHGIMVAPRARGYEDRM
jgi:hypothetical protein